MEEEARISPFAADRYQPWPLLRTQTGHNIPDEVLAAVWRKMVAEGKDKATFYDGGVNSEWAFIAYLKEPANQVTLIVDTKDNTVVMVAWLNGLEARGAKCHFCSIGPYRRGAGEEAVKFWSWWKWTDGTPLFKVIVGITPELYKAAVKALKLVGFTVIGTIPLMCELRHEGVRCGAVISYYCPKEE
jgi:hypothetical protein